MKEKLEKLKELCDLFRSNIKEYKSAKYDEANTRTDFIDKFFEVLDWDVILIKKKNLPKEAI